MFVQFPENIVRNNLSLLYNKQTGDSRGGADGQLFIYDLAKPSLSPGCQGTG